MKYTYVIELKDGAIVGHPIDIKNLQITNPEINIRNLPNNYCWFERVPKPRLKFNEKNQTLKYEIVGDICKDVWYAERLTDQELTEKIDQAKQRWQQVGWNSWNFNTTTFEFEPPIPRPQDGKIYTWDEPTLSWVLVPESE